MVVSNTSDGQQPGSNDTQQATVVSPPDADSTEFVIFQDEGEILSAQSNYHQIVWSSSKQRRGWTLTDSTGIITILDEPKKDKAWLSCVWDITFPQTRETPCQSIPLSTSGTTVGRVGSIAHNARRLPRIMGRMPIVWNRDNAQTGREKINSSCAFA